MPSGPTAPSFEISGGTLLVSGDLGPEGEPSFKEALRRLTEAGDSSPVVIDLSGVRYVSSSYVGHVATAVLRAKEKGRPSTVRATKRIARILGMAGIDKLCAVEVVEKRRPQQDPEASGRRVPIFTRGGPGAPFGPTAPSFEISGGTLRVSGDLGPEEEPSFKEALRRLTEAGGSSPVVIDLSGVRYVSSAYVRHVAGAILRAKEKGRQSTVRATKRVARILGMAGIEKLCAVEVAEKL